MNPAFTLWQKLMEKFHIRKQEWEPHWSQLEQLYSEPHRYYHTLTHIDSMASSLDKFAANAPPAVGFAIIYHDAIYNTRRSDNEERSADLVRQALANLGIPNDVSELTQELVLCTKNHKPIAGEMQATSALFLDLDLLIIGASRSEYDTYSTRIRQEYAWVPELEYCKARSDILSSFLKREQLFLTAEISQRFEAAAKDNLRSEISQLSERIQK